MIYHRRIYQGMGCELLIPLMFVIASCGCGVGHGSLGTQNDEVVRIMRYWSHYKPVLNSINLELF